MTPAASGLLEYADIEEIIEALIYTEGRRYPIPGLDGDDIAQEIRLECIRVMPSYDPSRIGPSPYKFLQVCVRNFLYNMRRGIYVPNNPPCTRCPLWDRTNKLCLVDEVGCDKIVQYRESMRTKAAIRRPNTLEVEVLDGGAEMDINAWILDESIRTVLPEHLISCYEKMISGRGGDVSPRHKKQVRDFVSQIVKPDA